MPILPPAARGGERAHRGVPRARPRRRVDHVDEVDEVAELAQAAGIRYPMLVDPAGDINLELGIRDEQYPVGSAAFGVPRPTLYIVDRSGTVRLRYMEPTYRTRPDLDVVLRDAADLVYR